MAGWVEITTLYIVLNYQKDSATQRPFGINLSY